MKPKKKDEEIDLSTLPPYLPLYVKILPKMKSKQAAKLMENLAQSKRTYYKIISKNDLINYAKEKQLYVDPAQITEKMRKDKNFNEICTELTPALLAKCFHAIVSDLNLQARKLKKDIQDAIAAGKDPSTLIKGGQDKKPQPQAQQAKGKKPVEVVPDLPPEKEFEKSFDYIYFTDGFPATKEDHIELSKLGVSLSVLINVETKEIEPEINIEENIKAQQNPEAFEEDMRKRLEEFDENHGKGKESQRLQEIPPEDAALKKELQLFMTDIKKAVLCTPETSPLRHHTFKDILIEYKTENEENIYRDLVELIFKEISSFSLDYSEFFDKWIPSKKKIPLIPPPPPPPVIAPPVQTQQEKEEGDQKGGSKGKQPAQAQKKAPAQPAAKTQPPGKGTPAPPVEEEKKVEVPEVIIKEPPKLKLDIYKSQLSEVPQENSTAGALIEAMLDQIAFEKDGNFVMKTEKKQDVESYFDSCFDDIFINKEKVSIDNEVQKVLADSKNKSTHYKKIIEENDKIEVKSYGTKFFNQDELSERERLTFNELKFPGLDRNMMPKIPEKSEKLRKAEKTQILSFISINETEFNHRSYIKMFEKMVAEYNQPLKWSFNDRIYIERHNKNTLAQSLFWSTLYDPVILTKYNAMDDNLLVLIYYNKPQGNILHRRWNNSFQVLPNLDLWLQYFKTNEENYNRNSFLDMDYQIIGPIQEKIQLLFPSDDSIFYAASYIICNQEITRYSVFKESFIVGISASQKIPGKSEIFIYLVNNSRILIEPEQYADEIVQTKTIDLINSEVMEPQTDRPSSPPSPELLKTYFYKSSINYTLVQGMVVKFLPNGDVMQMIDTQHVVGKKFEDENSSLVVYKTSVDQEMHRIISGKGSVIRYMKDGSIQTLQANGNISVCKKNGVWVVTNTKGNRHSHRIRDDTYCELDPLPCTIKKDPESGARIIMREDGVMITKFPDGSMLTNHADGTKILTSKAKDEILVEHPQYVSVKVKINEYRMRNPVKIGLGSSFSNHGSKDLFERSCNGIITQTFLWDGTVVEGLKEWRELEGYNNTKYVQVYLIKMKDSSVIKVEDDGEVVLIDSKDRNTVTEQKLAQIIDAQTQNLQGKQPAPASSKEAEADKIKFMEIASTEYFMNLYLPKEERSGGILTANILNNTIETNDNEGNHFEINSQGKITTQIAISINLGDAESKNIPPSDLEGEWYPPENKDLPHPKSTPAPRLFVIENNNSGYELLNKNQLKYYKKMKKDDPDSAIIKKKDVEGYLKYKSNTFITRLKSIQEANPPKINVSLPNIVLPIPQTILPTDEPQFHTFLYRNILKFPYLTPEDQEKLNKELQNYENWKIEQQKQISEFGNSTKRTDEEKEDEYNIQQKILENRKKTIKKETYEEALSVGVDTYFKQVDEKNKQIEKEKFEKMDFELKKKQRIAFEKEEKIRNRVMRNIYEEKNRHIIANYQKYKKELEDQENVRQITGRIVHSYYHTFLGREFMMQNYYTPFKKLRLTHEEKEIAKRLQELGKSILDQQGSNEQNVLGSNANGTGFKFSGLKNPHAFMSTTLGKDRDRKTVMDNLKADKIELEARLQSSTKKDFKISTKDSNLLKKSKFTMIDEENEKKDQEKMSRLQHIQQMKTPEYNPDGSKRLKQPFIPVLLKSNAENIVNSAYLKIEGPTESRIRTSSLSQKPHIKASSVHEMRNEGKHATLIKSMDKKNDIKDLLEKKTLMITSGSDTQNQQDILIIPNEVLFGIMKKGEKYQIVVSIKNEDYQSQRIKVKPSETFPTKGFSFTQNNHGLIAPGLTREITVEIDTNETDATQIEDRLLISTRYRIYSVPVKGIINDLNTMENKYPLKVSQTIWNKTWNLKSVVKSIAEEIPEKSELNNSSDQEETQNKEASSDMLTTFKFDKNSKIDLQEKIPKKKTKINVSGTHSIDNRSISVKSQISMHELNKTLSLFFFSSQIQNM